MTSCLQIVVYFKYIYAICKKGMIIYSKISIDVLRKESKNQQKKQHGMTQTDRQTNRQTTNVQMDGHRDRQRDRETDTVHITNHHHHRGHQPCAEDVLATSRQLSRDLTT